MFAHKTTSPRNNRSSNRTNSFRPSMEALEERNLMSVVTAALANSATQAVLVNYVPPAVALINGLPSSAVRNVALADYQRDGFISRNDMMDIFKTGTTGYTTAPTAVYNSLNTLISNGATVGMPGYVQDLANKTLFGAHGLLLGELKAMQSDDVSQAAYNNFMAHEDQTLAQDIRMEVNTWFLGATHPNANFTDSSGKVVTPTYQATTKPLFTGTPSYTDVNQGFLGDCWLMASVAEIAARNPAAITNMFIDNGDSTYTVRLYVNGAANYITTDNMLPSGGNLYDHPQANTWAAMLEKAYVQANGFSWVGSQYPGVNSYQALNGGYPEWALPGLTGANAPTDDPDAAASAFNQGKYVVLCTPDDPSSPLVVPTHCYAALSVDASGAIKMYNPWGTGGGTSAENNKYYPGTITIASGALSDNFEHVAMAGAPAVTPTLVAAPGASELGTTQFVAAFNSPAAITAQTAVFQALATGENSTLDSPIDSAMPHRVAASKTIGAMHQDTIAEVFASEELTAVGW